MRPAGGDAPLAHGMHTDLLDQLRHLHACATRLRAEVLNLRQDFAALLTPAGPGGGSRPPSAEFLRAYT